jgi:mitochondrial-processing peptidase subunit alpha
MHSRLYTRVLNQHHWVHNASAFSSVYDHTGLAGIHITTETGKIEQGIDIACKELQVCHAQPTAAMRQWADS